MSKLQRQREMAVLNWEQSLDWIYCIEACADDSPDPEIRALLPLVHELQRDDVLTSEQLTKLREIQVKFAPTISEDARRNMFPMPGDPFEWVDKMMHGDTGFEADRCKRAIKAYICLSFIFDQVQVRRRKKGLPARQPENN